jgi:glucose/mannose-6-phosphate isomerase
MRRDVPEQIGDALWRVDAAGVPHGPVEVCGVDYRAGEFASLIVGDRGSSDGERVVLCASYSGDDEEAIECFERARGRTRVAICTAGALAARAREQRVPVVGVPAGFEDPREAVVYFVVAAVTIAAPHLKGELEAAAAKLALIEEGGDFEPETKAERVFAQDLASAEP